MYNPGAMTTQDHSEMKLAELAERSGVPPRTIRLYITQGLLPGPLRAGRDAAYGEAHLERLRLIREFQSNGLTLAQIRRRLAGEEPAAGPEPVPMLSYAVSEDVTVLVRGDMSPRRLRQVRNAIGAMQDRLKQGGEEEGHDND